MKRFATCLLVLGLFACNGGESQEVEDLTRRISQLEKKVKSLEQASKGGKQAKKGKGGDKGAKSGGDKTARSAKGEKGEKGEKAGTAEKGAKSGGVDPATFATITAEGDASRVVLAQGKKRLPLPGKAPAGTYVVMAAFGETPLAKAGEVTVAAKQSVTVNCTSADKTCASGS